MDYAYLGDSGLIVSKLDFGAMTFSAPGAMAFAGLGKADGARVVDMLLDAGVTLFDTANVYSNGQSETILGGYLAARRNDVIIVTKAGSRTGNSPNDVGLSARHAHIQVDASLKRLNSDWIDVYLCHLPDTRTPLDETLFTYDQLVRSGKVRYIGFSNWPAWLASKAVAIQRANGLARFVAGQYQYNLLDREVDAEIVPALLDAGVGLMAYSPLASGMLSGKYAGGDASGGGHGRLSRITMPPGMGHDPERVVALLAKLEAIAATRSVHVAAVSIAWLKRQPPVSTILMGINTIEQATANLAAADIDLTEDESAALGAVGALPHRYPRTLFNMLGDGWADPRDRLAPPVMSQQGLWAMASS